MKSANPDINWNTVTKGRRTRKSKVRNLNIGPNVSNSTSPKRVGDFSGSDSDKYCEAVIGQSTSGKLESVPIKKRRNLIKSSSSKPSSEGEQKCPYPSRSSGKRSYSSRGNDGSAETIVGKRKGFISDRTEVEYDCEGDFSGIELLAAAASMDYDAVDNANKVDLVAADLLLPKNSNVSDCVTQSKLCSEQNESEKSSSNTTVQGVSTDCSIIVNESADIAIQQPGGSPEDVDMPKVNRQHWDLNIPMDAWEEPYDDSVAGNNLMDVIDNNTHMEKTQTNSKDDILVPSCTGDKSSDRATEIDADDGNSNQALSCDGRVEISNHVMKTSPLIKLPPSSILSQKTLDTVCTTAAVMQDEDCSSNVFESERVTASDQIQTKSQDVILDAMTAIELAKSATDVKCKDADVIASKTINSATCKGLDVDIYRSDSDDVNYSPSKCVNFLATGTYVEDDKSALIADFANQNGETFAIGSTECQGKSQPTDLFPKDEDDNLSNKGSKRIITENSCKSDDPTNSVGKTGSTTNDRRDSDVSHHNHAHMINGDASTRFPEEGYDSPFEDGELRGSFLYSWEVNELEDECVDYESDGRNGDGSDGGDYPGSGIVEDVSEGSRATVRRTLSTRRFSQGNGSKSGSGKHSSRSHFIKDDSNNNEIAGKGESNAGSGTTVEQMEMVIEENGTKRRNMTGVRDSVDGKVALMDEYGSKMARGKLQPRIPGRSSMDAVEGKDVSFMEQFRSRRPGGSYSRHERGISPDKYVGRFRPATSSGKRDGPDQWTNWGPRRCYNTPSYEGPEGHNNTRPRHITSDSPDKYGEMDYRKPRQNANYMSKGFDKPFVRRPPMDRDDSFGVRRRMPLTRGVSSYRGRGHYSQRSDRDFGEDFDSRPDEFLPKRERNFSPSSGRGSHVPLPRRRSRSRSRTRSPRAWVPNRERNLGPRRFSRSPDFRPEGRMDRTRVPFPKPNFASDFGEGYNARWDDDRNFGENHLRRRRSPPPPVRVFRRNQNSEENFRPPFRPGKFPFMGRESKFEQNYDDRRRDGNDEMMHRRPHYDDQNGVNFRRLRCNNDFQTSSLSNNLKNETDSVLRADPREVPPVQIDMQEDKQRLKFESEC